MPLWFHGEVNLVRAFQKRKGGGIWVVHLIVALRIRSGSRLCSSFSWNVPISKLGLGWELSDAGQRAALKKEGCEAEEVE